MLPHFVFCFRVKYSAHEEVVQLSSLLMWKFCNILNHKVPNDSQGDLLDWQLNIQNKSLLIALNQVSVLVTVHVKAAWKMSSGLTWRLG